MGLFFDSLVDLNLCYYLQNKVVSFAQAFELRRQRHDLPPSIPGPPVSPGSAGFACSESIRQGFDYDDSSKDLSTQTRGRLVLQRRVTADGTSTSCSVFAEWQTWFHYY